MKENEGSLWKNTRSTKTNAPGYTGKAMIGGKLYWVSMWINTIKGGAKKGEQMCNLKYDLAEEKPNQQANYSDQEPDSQQQPF